MVILLDMDGVVADFLPALLERYNFLTNENVPLDRIKSNKTHKWVGDPMLYRKLIDTPGFMYSLPPIDGAIESISKLKRDGHDVVFVSNATNCPTSGNEKREWLKYYFSKVWPGHVPLILTSDKWRVRGDVLLDDDPKNLINLHPTTRGLLFNKTYNADVIGFDPNKKEIISGKTYNQNLVNFERIYDWSHFLNWVEDNK